MATILLALLSFVIAYVMGSIPPAYIIGRVFYGVDIRKHGSGNVGGANAARLFGYHVLVIVALYDIFKGTLAVFIAQALTNTDLPATGFFSLQQNIMATAAFIAVFGHCYSIWLKFAGGKGGATSAGIILAFNPLAFLIILIVWVLIVYTTRFTSLGNLSGVLLIPILFATLGEPPAYIVLGGALVVLIFWKHRQNIGRLMRGEERKFGTREKIEPPANE